MLKSEVLEAVEEEKFYIYSITTIDEGMEILTDMKMGEPSTEGQYPTGTLNQIVKERLNRFALIRKEYAIKPNGKE